MTIFKPTPAVSPRNQRLSTCCWLTCLEMMFEWKQNRGDSSKDPNKIMSELAKAPNLDPEYMRDHGISSLECKETAKTLGLRWSGDGEIQADVLYNLMLRSGPIWIAGAWQQGHSHVIVITGIDKDSGVIACVDPWRNYDLSEVKRDLTWLNNRGFWKNCDASIMYWL